MEQRVDLFNAGNHGLRIARVNAAEFRLEPRKIVTVMLLVKAPPRFAEAHSDIAPVLIIRLLLKIAALGDYLDRTRDSRAR